MQYRHPSKDLLKSKKPPVKADGDVSLRNNQIWLNIYLKGETARCEMSLEEAAGLAAQIGDYLAIAAAQARCVAGEAMDEDRILLARRHGRMMHGPEEREACHQHEGEHRVVRWSWDVPVDGDHARAIESGEPEVVKGCPRCIEENLRALKSERLAEPRCVTRTGHEPL